MFGAANGRFPPFLPMAFAVAATTEQARRKAGSTADETLPLLATKVRFCKDVWSQLIRF